MPRAIDREKQEEGVDMPLQIDVEDVGKFPTPQYLTLNNWKKGVITLINESRLPKDALKEADNLFLYEDGMPGPRPGVGYYGTASPNTAAIQGADYYQASDGTSHVVMVAGGNIYRSIDDCATWTICTGATLDTTADVNSHQDGGYLYITNGIDSIVRYDGSTTLQIYTSLATPSTPTTAAAAGLTSGTLSNTYYYKYSAVNEVGNSIASANSTILSVNCDRTQFTTTNKITVTLSSVAGATRYDVYSSDTATGTYYYLGSTSTLVFVDDGTWLLNPSVEAPDGNTTEGPLVEELSGVGSRMYGVRDTVNKYRIWASSATTPGAFSPSYDAAYIDWQPGGKFFPKKAVDYRSGKGDPLATVWCDSADGQGCIIQVTLETLTVGDVSITVPSAYRLPGSRGTPAPGSVVNVLNDYFYYNSQAFYNIGTRAQLQNILSTDEASSNIRPTVKQISQLGESKIASVYFDARIYFSVPYGASENNATIVYDTERRAWLPKAFTIGFSKFLRYTDTDGSQKLLCWKPGDTQLSEISASIQGDYGEPFNTSLITGLYSVNRNRFEFEFTEEGEVEFSNPQGDISIELLGIERSRGYRAINSETVTPTVTNIGWDTFNWDTTNWDDTSTVPDLFSESSIKRYFTVQRELNAVQWRITTSSLGSAYVARTLQTWGTPTFSGKPRAWRL